LGVSREGDDGLPRLLSGSTLIVAILAPAVAALAIAPAQARKAHRKHATHAKHRTIKASNKAGKTAAEPRFEKALEKLDPATRFVQVCDLEAMRRIGQSTTAHYSPDRAVVDSISKFQIKDDTMEGKGGAFRSKGEWRQFSFTCKVSPDRMKVVSFDYKVGDLIPESKWETYELYP
jgi:hypothetical protein